MEGRRVGMARRKGRNGKEEGGRGEGGKRFQKEEF